MRFAQLILAAISLPPFRSFADKMPGGEVHEPSNSEAPALTKGGKPQAANYRPARIAL